MRPCLQRCSAVHLKDKKLTRCAPCFTNLQTPDAKDTDDDGDGTPDWLDRQVMNHCYLGCCCLGCC